MSKDCNCVWCPLRYLAFTFKENQCWWILIQENVATNQLESPKIGQLYLLQTSPNLFFYNLPDTSISTFFTLIISSGDTEADVPETAAAATRRFSYTVEIRMLFVIDLRTHQFSHFLYPPLRSPLYHLYLTPFSRLWQRSSPSILASLILHSYDDRAWARIYNL